MVEADEAPYECTGGECWLRMGQQWKSVVGEEQGGADTPAQRRDGGVHPYLGVPHAMRFVRYGYGVPSARRPELKEQKSIYN